MDRVHQPAVLDLKQRYQGTTKSAPGVCSRPQADAFDRPTVPAKRRFALRIKKSYLALLLTVLGFVIGLWWNQNRTNTSPDADANRLGFSYLQFVPLTEEERNQIIQSRDYSNYLAPPTGGYNFVDTLLFELP